MKDNIKMGF